MRNEIKLSTVADIIMGQSPESSACNDLGIGKPFLQGCAEFGDKYPIIKNYCTSPKKLSPENSILISVRAPVGDVNWANQEVVIGRGLAGIVPRNIDKDFLYYSIIQFREQLVRLSQGSTFEAINSSDLHDFTIKEFTPIEQKKIAQILSTCDEVIEQTEAAIAKYQALKQGMMYDLFTRGIDTQTGKLRPIPEDAPELYKESALGLIPKEWGVERMDEIVEIRVSNVDKKIHAGKKLVRLCNYMDAYNNDFITNDMDFMIGSADNNECSRFSLLPQDVIITKDSETPDDIAIPSVVIENLDNVVCGYHLAILRPQEGLLNGEFLMYNLKLPRVQRYFFRIASGSTRYGLTIGGIEAVQLAIPPLDEQLELKNRLRSIDLKIETEEITLTKYQQLKSGLMQDLLTGKVEVDVEPETSKND